VKNGERVETLTKLGLTRIQARTYLTLLQIGPATAKELSRILQIARPDIYRIIPTLENEGLIETVIARPSVYKATPLGQTIDSLLERKIKEQDDLKKRVEELLNDFKNDPADREPVEAGTDFVMVPGKEAIIQKLRNSLLKAQISLCVVTSKTRFSAAIIEFAYAYRKALKKGVRIRIAAEQHVPSKTALEIVQALSQNPNFEVKYFTAPPPAIVVMFDSKEACVTMSAVANLAEASALWSNNPSFIALAQNYFENKWNDST
jgi:sugar-specific transcriptional regulator TrmB